MNNLLLGFLYNLAAQILTFLQLQGNVKYDWYEKYPILTLGVSIPISWAFIKSIKYFSVYFNGEIWPSRLIGFGIGIIVFVILSLILFKEPLYLKTIICVILAIAILTIQMIWK